MISLPMNRRGEYEFLIQAEIMRELDEKEEMVMKVTREHMISTSFCQGSQTNQIEYNRIGSSRNFL